MNKRAPNGANLKEKKVFPKKYVNIVREKETYY